MASIPDIKVTQEEEVTRRWHRVVEQTSGWSETDPNNLKLVDNEAMAIQDPVWAQLVANNSELKEDLKEYIERAEGRLRAAREQLGW